MEPSPPEDVFPDGCGEIVLNLADPFFRHAEGPPTAQPRAMVVGVTTAPMRIRPSGAIDVVGIRFHPHGARLALAAPCHELTDSVFPLEAFASPMGEWEERLHETPIWASRARLLERWLSDWLDERRADALTEAASGMIAQTGGGIRVDDLCQRLGVPPRRLERRFRAQVGITPKRLCRITRFQRVLKVVQRSESRLAAAAVRCGYSDQAHLTRDFRDFTGLTPGEFLGSDDLLPRLFAGLGDPGGDKP